jgi:choline dehydrogenase
LAAGALSTPKIMFFSGVGPKDMLDTVGLPTKLDLPGVGQRLQDHMTAGVIWETPWQTAGDLQKTGDDFSKSKEFLSFINDCVAFANASLLFEGNHTQFRDSVLATIDNSTQTLVPSKAPEVIAGYKKIFNLTATKFFDDTAQIELLMSLISPGTVAIQAAIQHPYSIGRMYLNSSNPWDGVVIDPGFHTHWADRVMMRQGVKLVRRLGQAYGAALGQEVVPGPNYQTDDGIDSWMVHEPTGAGSQFHPTGTTSLLPKALGGVVGNDLKVYGLANVRVVDGGVFPFEYAAHLASAGFGVAEQASDLIKSLSYSVDKAQDQKGAALAISGGVSFKLVTAIVAGLVLFLNL